MASLSEQVSALRALQAGGEHGRALAEAEALLAATPGDRDLALIRASALRHLRRTDEALAALAPLIGRYPEFSLAHQERGLAHVARKEAREAIAALLQAVNLNPALPHAWRMLEGLYRLTGDGANAATAHEHVQTLAALPSPIIEANALFADGDIESAETIIRAFLQSHGDHPDAMRLLARIALAYDVLDDAERLLAGVMTIAPDHLAARVDYAGVLIKRQKYAGALELVAPLRAIEPDNLDYLSIAATALAGMGRHNEAIAAYRKLIERVPDDADPYLWLGHALKAVGQVPAAIEAYRAAIARRPAFGDAWWSLANLKTYPFAGADLAAMQAHEASPEIAENDRVEICFALGKAFEDIQDFAQSWHYYARGNALKRAASKYRPEIVETNTALQKLVCTPAFFAERADWGAPAGDPIFIVGLPRAGSTLIEQILASHSQVEGTQELIDIQRMVIDLQGRDADLDNPRYPGTLLNLSPENVRALGERYLADTRMYRTGRPHFIDKMPNNFRHIGLIHLILPNARIIDARREPMACCFSNFKQLFAQGQEFTYSLEDIARYYRTYLELMRHWDQALPARVLRVTNDDVIDDLEGQVRRILEYCALPFEPGCLAFHETRRAVRTPSSEQVRRPVNRDGTDQWRNFAGWLEPLRAALGDALETWRD